MAGGGLELVAAGGVEVLGCGGSYGTLCIPATGLASLLVADGSDNIATGLYNMGKKPEEQTASFTLTQIYGLSESDANTIKMIAAGASIGGELGLAVSVNKATSSVTVINNPIRSSGATDATQSSELIIVVKTTTTDTDVKHRLESIENAGKAYQKVSKGINSVVSDEMAEKILYGQRQFNKIGNPSNRITGAHSGEILRHDDFASELIGINSDGTKNVKLIKQFSDGGISRIKNSTLFPESWSDEKIISATIQVGNTKSMATRPRDNATLHQFQIDGINIEVIKIGDNVISSYPCGNNCTSTENFIK